MLKASARGTTARGASTQNANLSPQGCKRKNVNADGQASHRLARKMFNTSSLPSLRKWPISPNRTACDAMRSS